MSSSDVNSIYQFNLNIDNNISNNISSQNNNIESYLLLIHQNFKQKNNDISLLESKVKLHQKQLSQKNALYQKLKIYSQNLLTQSSQQKKKFDKLQNKLKLIQKSYIKQKKQALRVIKENDQLNQQLNMIHKTYKEKQQKQNERDQQQNKKLKQQQNYKNCKIQQLEQQLKLLEISHQQQIKLINSNYQSKIKQIQQTKQTQIRTIQSDLQTQKLQILQKYQQKLLGKQSQQKQYNKKFTQLLYKYTQTLQKNKQLLQKLDATNFKLQKSLNDLSEERKITKSIKQMVTKKYKKYYKKYQTQFSDSLSKTSSNDSSHKNSVQSSYFMGRQTDSSHLEKLYQIVFCNYESKLFITSQNNSPQSANISSQQQMTFEKCSGHHKQIYNPQNVNKNQLQEIQTQKIEHLRFQTIKNQVQDLSVSSGLSVQTKLTNQNKKLKNYLNDLQDILHKSKQQSKIKETQKKVV